MKIKPRQSGFTLVEVLVALTMVAIMMSTMLYTSSTYTRNAFYLKQKTLAQWVAENKAIEYQLDPKLATIGKKTGEAEMTNVKWRWQSIINSNPAEPRLRVIEIKVTTEDGDFNSPLATLLTYVYPG